MSTHRTLEQIQAGWMRNVNDDVCSALIEAYDAGRAESTDRLAELKKECEERGRRILEMMEVLTEDRREKLESLAARGRLEAPYLRERGFGILAQRFEALDCPAEPAPPRCSECGKPLTEHQS